MALKLFEGQICFCYHLKTLKPGERVKYSATKLLLIIQNSNHSMKLKKKGQGVDCLARGQSSPKTPPPFIESPVVTSPTQIHLFNAILLKMSVLRFIYSTESDDFQFTEQKIVRPPILIVWTDVQNCSPVTFLFGGISSEKTRNPTLHSPFQSIASKFNVI